MRIVNLVENTEGAAGCAYAHGLCFYVETEKHKLLSDLGPDAVSLENAEKLGIDLTKVDTVILSHGHYDHSGGIMPFVGINPKAAIYMQDNAGEDYYADDGEEAGDKRFRYIGIDKRIMELPQVKTISGDYRIDDELELFTIGERTHALPSTNKRLLKKDGGKLVPDGFKHEHFLVIGEGKRKVLISGCAHNGIISIMDAYIAKYKKAPDKVISGFHLMKKTEYTEAEIDEIRTIAGELRKYPTEFVTCHCTGVPAYEIMKAVMGEQLCYVHSGGELLSNK